MFFSGSERVYPTHPTTAERMQYISAAAGLRFQITGNESLEVTWTNNASYSAAIDKFRQEITTRYTTMIRQLQGLGLLSNEEAAQVAMPVIEFTVDDRRSVRTPL